MFGGGAKQAILDFGGAAALIAPPPRDPAGAKGPKFFGVLPWVLDFIKTLIVIFTFKKFLVLAQWGSVGGGGNFGRPPPQFQKWPVLPPPQT